MLITKGTKSYVKKEFSQSLGTNTAYSDLRFADICVGGETYLDLTSVTIPPEMAANGYTNPSAASIAAANLLFNKRNVEVKSHKRGILVQGLHYTIPTSSKINLLGFTAEADEIFEVTLKSNPLSGFLAVDGTQVVNTGVLSFGQTDFATDPFEYQKFPLKQVGAVLVFRDSKPQFRCENNDITKDGDYIEVSNSTGLTNLIRFKTPAAKPDSVAVISVGSLVERPTSSMMAVIETIAGQMDKVIPALAAVTGRPTTDFQGAPNSVDQSTFGNTVLNHESRITAVESKVIKLWTSYYCSANKSSNTTVPLDFDTAYEGNMGLGWVTTGAAWKFTAKTGYSGLYNINFMINITNGATSFIGVYKNGIFYKTVSYFVANGIAYCSCDVPLNAGEYFDLRFQNSNTAVGGSSASFGVSNISIRYEGPTA